MPTWGVNTLPNQRAPQKILKKSISLYYTAASGLIYFSYGTKDVLERQCQNLNNKLEVFMDGKKIELPEIGIKYRSLKLRF